MPEVFFIPENIKIEVPAGTEIHEAVLKAGIELDYPCGGKGTCGKCKVKVIDGPVDNYDQSLLTQDEINAGFIMSCKSKLLDKPVKIEIPERSGYHGGQFADNMGNIKLFQDALSLFKSKIHPIALKLSIEVMMPVSGDGLSDLDRLQKALRKTFKNQRLEFYFPVLRKLAEALRMDNGKVTVTLAESDDTIIITDVESGDTTSQYYGMAIDIGTTTVAVYLLNLDSGEVLEAATDYNGQISCGLDVISRINYSQKPGRLEELRIKVLDTVNSLIARVCGHAGIKPEIVCAAALSGNTTMTHLLLGLPPENIRLSPYVPTVMALPYLNSSDIGIHIKPGSAAFISPAVGSYVGGDITAGVLCTDLTRENTDTILFIDIGTNGEIVIGNHEYLVTCACSAGPAFEGGEITFGMRASNGAIERVEIDTVSGKASCSVIGNEKPVGICGSGMISLIAELFIKGFLDPDGKLGGKKESSFVKTEGRRSSYAIASQDESGCGKPITISDLDIEKIMRAKAAIFSACSLILEQLEIGFQNLGKIYIAGGFGRFLDIEKAITIGLLPDLPIEKFHYIGNSSLNGTALVLVSKEYRDLQKAVSGKMTYIDLSSLPDYMRHYTSALFLPHTDNKLFPNSIRKS